MDQQKREPAEHLHTDTFVHIEKEKKHVGRTKCCSSNFSIVSSSSMG